MMNLLNGRKAATLLLAAAMLLGAAGAGHAVDFKIKGMWQMGFGMYDSNLVSRTRAPGASSSRKASTNDQFAARQRLLLQMDAAASENLSGAVQLIIGPTKWGKNGTRQGGGAMGADGTEPIKVRQAYLDWTVPGTSITTRMGLQNFSMPNAAGGSSVFDLRGAAVVTHGDFNENIGLTAMWFRPFNDNYGGGGFGRDGGGDSANHLDNMDLFSLSLPMRFDGVSVEPWIMYGIQGRNAGSFQAYRDDDFPDGYAGMTLTPFMGYSLGGGHGLNWNGRLGGTSKAYGSMFWAGLPVKLTALDPLNVEFDINYGYVEALGRFDVVARNNPADVRRASTKREGWVAKALVEYKTDWGVPGIFGWYGSGDDGNVRNGSERMPNLCGYTNFTSFMGDGNLYWGPAGDIMDLSTSYAGSWGLGLQIRDMSWIEDLTHTVRVAWWGGTNSPSMVRYMDTAYATREGYVGFDGPYLTTNDGLLEVNIVNNYKIYENLSVNFELGYIANFIDDDTWKRRSNGSYDKQDAWKGQLVFTYRF